MLSLLVSLSLSLLFAHNNAEEGCYPGLADVVKRLNDAKNKQTHMLHPLLYISSNIFDTKN